MTVIFILNIKSMKNKRKKYRIRILVTHQLFQTLKQKQMEAKTATTPKPKAKKARKKVVKVIFDYKTLSRDILQKRTKEDLSFRVIQKQSGVPVHILHSVESRKMIPNCVNFAKVLTWLGRTANTYFVTVAKSK